MDSPAASPDKTAPLIVVTGDLIKETHLYQGSRNFAADSAANGFLIQTGLGGANLIHELLEASKPGISRLGLQIDGSKPWPAHLEVQALYAPCAGGFKGDPPQPPVWRASKQFGYGCSLAAPPPEPPVERPDLAGAEASVLVIDDGAAGFRTLRAKSRWPDFSKPLPPWVVLKMSQPLCEGHLWRELVTNCRSGSPDSASSLVVVVSADELRRAGAAINRGLSWERTITDICQTLAHHPQLSALRKAEHVIVVFRREGALWIRQSKDSHGKTTYPTTLIIDTSLAEGQWKTALNEDRSFVFGGVSVMTAAIALQLAGTAKSDPIDEKEFASAVERGLIGIRELRLRGHGIVKQGSAPALPLTELAAIIKSKEAKRPQRQKHQPQDCFVRLALPDDAGTSLPCDWTIAGLDAPGMDAAPLYGHAFQAAIYGPSRLVDLPHARFGDLLSVDRDEIETLRSLRQLIQEYEQNGPQKQPLCLAAFGPPGAGKSFGIKQISYEILGKDVPFLEFNLSQFSDPGDLIGAFHQVRDKVLGGRTPVVFWDEFDSQQFKWLQFLLAPMQDGKFQSGQLTHTLGKCIFVFAGATSWDFEHFGPAPAATNPAEQKALDELESKRQDLKADRQKKRAEFALAKGPDFLSRLTGHINVLGPNRRLQYNFATGHWDLPDPRDITFPIRRALLLRSLLKWKATDILRQIDRDLLNGLLRLPRYRHGSRSMEKTVMPLRGSFTDLRPAQLPPPQVLAQHLETVDVFLKLLTENREFLTSDNVRALAAAIHENYRLLNPGNILDPKFREEFDKLDASRQATNFAAAIRIPYVLAMAGLCVVPGKASSAERDSIKARLKRFIGPLQREEHFQWYLYMETNGWLQSQTSIAGKPVRDNDQLLHNCMLPFDELSEADQQKDYNAIVTLPDAVDLVGFKIVPFPDIGA